MPFTAPPPPPNRNNPADFSERADAFLAWFVTFVSELNDAGYPVLPVLAAAGSAAAPSHSFSANPNMGLYRAAANQLGFSVGGVRRALLTASAMQFDVPLTGQAVVSGPTDSTAGRLLTTGYMGLGANSIVDVTDYDAITRTGFYRNTSAATGSPTAGTLYWSVFHLAHASDGTSSQLAMRSAGTATDEMYFRRKASGVWQPWVKVFHSSNILGTVSQSGGVPTEAIIERGSNANGSYVRFADGTQMCWFGTSASASESTTVTFPAAFAGAGTRITATVYTADDTILTPVIPRIAAITETDFKLNIVTTAGARAAVYAFWQSIGRWF